MTITISPKKITKENFAKFGELISTSDINPISINNGYAWIIGASLGAVVHLAISSGSKK